MKRQIFFPLAFSIFSSLPSGATTLEGATSVTDTECSSRMTPFFSVNYGGTIIKLGQQLFPNFESCTFFCLGDRIYVYDDKTLLGIIDKDYGFHCADKVLVNWIQPRPELIYAASKSEVREICSKVFCSPTDLTP